MLELKLSNAKRFIKYKIKKILTSEQKILNELKNFGIVENCEIILIGTNFGKKSYLINVDGINYAIDKSICDRIILYA